MKRGTPNKEILVIVILSVILLFFMFPVLWMVLTSFKTKSEYFSYPPVFIPKHFSFHNYLHAMQYPPDGRGGIQGLRDSLIISISSTLVSIIVGALAAYGIVRFKTGGENLSFWILSIRMFPPVASVLPLFLIFKQIKLMYTHYALIVANTIFNLPFVVWLLKGFFEEIPAELEEAALIDGCSNVKAFVRITIPLTTPGLATASLFSFIFSWNEFMFALLLTRRNVRTLTVVVGSLVGGHEILWGEIAAIGVIAIIPGILLAIFLQKYIIRGLTLGAIKG